MLPFSQKNPVFGLIKPEFLKEKYFQSGRGYLGLNKINKFRAYLFTNLFTGFYNYNIPLKSNKTKRFDKLLAFARSHSIVTRTTQ